MCLHALHLHVNGWLDLCRTCARTAAASWRLGSRVSGTTCRRAMQQWKGFFFLVPVPLFQKGTAHNVQYSVTACNSACLSVEVDTMACVVGAYGATKTERRPWLQYSISRGTHGEALCELMAVAPAFSRSTPWLTPWTGLQKS